MKKQILTVIIVVLAFFGSFWLVVTIINSIESRNDKAISTAASEKIAARYLEKNDFIAPVLNTPAPVINTQTQSSIADDELINEFETSYIDGCLGEANGQIAYCQCTYNYLEKKLGKKGLIQLGLEFYTDKELSDKNTDIMADAVGDCLNEYNY